MYLSVNQKKALALVLRKRRATHTKRVWVHAILKDREELGEFHHLVRDLRCHADRFETYFRLDPEQFSRLLSMVGPSISKLDSTYRKAIRPSERLVICLRYLATGDSYTTIACSYRVGISTVFGIVPAVSQAIWDCLVEQYMPVPGKEEWRAITESFQQRWNFPNCVGAIDGKHVLIQAPPSSGSQYFNYKGSFSIVLLALVDAQYRFRIVDVGAFGRSSDGGTLSASAFGKALRENRLALPDDAPLPGAEHLGPVPHVIVGDEAFPLRKDLLRPYPGRNLTRVQRVFNYRLFHARRIVENAFGILASQWRVYRRVIGVHPENVEKTVKATTILHNFLRWHSVPVTDPTSSTGAEDGPHALHNIARVSSNNASREALAVREIYSNFFSSAAGEVPWQHDVV